MPEKNNVIDKIKYFLALQNIFDLSSDEVWDKYPDEIWVDALKSLLSPIHIATFKLLARDERMEFTISECIYNIPEYENLKVVFFKDTARGLTDCKNSYYIEINNSNGIIVLLEFCGGIKFKHIAIYHQQLSQRQLSTILLLSILSIRLKIDGTEGKNNEQ